MDKLQKLLRNRFTVGFLTLFGGWFVSYIIETIIGNVIPLSMGIIFVVFVIFIIFVLILFVDLRKDISERDTRTRLNSRVYYADKTPGGDKILYDPVIDIIKQAEKSIRVIGLYRPSTLPVTPGRKKYYQALHDFLETKQKRAQPFLYDRIIQVSNVRPGQISSDQVDPLTFSHIRDLLSLQKNKSSVTIRLRQIPDILGSLSFVIVDDRDIIFALPDVAHSDTVERRGFHLGSGVVFTDNDGALVKELIHIFEELCYPADPIFSVSPDSQSSK